MVLILIAALISFGGIKKVTKVTDLLVPVMAVIYVLTVVVLAVCNFTRIPWFFQAVFGQAFSAGCCIWRSLRHSAQPGH